MNGHQTQKPICLFPRANQNANTLQCPTFYSKINCLIPGNINVVVYDP